MNYYKDKLEILRQRIPVGLQHGLTLLEKADGDLEKAEKQFQDEMVSLTINKTGVGTDVAIRHLMKNSFDIGLTVKSIDEERHTLTELFLRKYKNKKEEALNKIMHAIEEKYHLKRNFWLIFDDLKELPSEIYCFLTTMEWLNYENWEDFDTALSFHLNIITEQIEQVFSLPELANSLREANNIQRLIYEKNKTGKDIQNYTDARNKLPDNKAYQKCEEDFKTQKPLLIDRLYEFVKTNIDKYP